jgi:isoleucyl-tRNA synthetase
LWVASVDYHTDVKISYDIIKQIGEYYRKIRNTARFILGSLYDFDPNTDLISFENLFNIDKYILLKFYNLANFCYNLYEKFEFHNIFHTIHKFCVVDLSNFYLDILKDRLYVYGKKSLERKTAQTTMYVILNLLTKLLCPILPYTSEEIWKFLPHKKCENSQSIFLNELTIEKISNENQELLEYWTKIIDICEKIKKILEISRKNKIIGSSLESEITIFCDNNRLYEFLKTAKEDLKIALIVSKINLESSGNGEYNFGDSAEKFSVTVKRFAGQKCPRCWNYFEQNSPSIENTDLCPKCTKILKTL